MIACLLADQAGWHLARKRLASGHSGTQRPLSGRNLPIRARERMFAERSPDRVGKPKQKHPRTDCKHSS